MSRSPQEKQQRNFPTKKSDPPNPTIFRFIILMIPSDILLHKVKVAVLNTQLPL